MKIHVGCGPIYLKHFINIDLLLPNHYLAKDRPDLVKKNITTVKNYYKKDVTRQDILIRKFHHEEVVVDEYGQAEALRFPDNSLEEIRSVQLFEHFSFEDGKKLLYHWCSRLKADGKVHIDIPDLDDTIRLYNTDPIWATRLLFGSQKNEYGFHRSMYSRERIKKLLLIVGFKKIKFSPNIHFYPAFAIEGTK